MKKYKSQIKIALIAIAVCIVLVLFVKRAAYVVKKDAELLEYVLSDEGMEKSGEGIGKAANTLEDRKDSFMEGFKKTREENKEEN